jgi:hypothetical protein
VRLNGYNLIMIGLASAMVYPDYVLFWINQKTGRKFSATFVVLLEVVAVALMAVAIKVFMPIYPMVEWSDIWLYIGVLCGVRIFYWICETLFRWLFDV